MTITLGFDQVQAAKVAISQSFGIQNDTTPRIGIVLGSGLGPFADQIKPLSNVRSLSYASFPHFPTSSVEGHSGNLLYGSLSNIPVIAMQGRIHRYEGYSSNAVVFPIRVMAALGVKTLILTNAAGAINATYRVGDLMLIADHINLTGDNPQLGPNDERFGLRFFDMTEAYSKRARKLAHEGAAKEKIQLREGCYLGILGPSYETPAEIRMMRTLGADAVGMSTVFETIAARHMGVEVLGISCMTNMAAGVTGAKLDHSEVQEAAQIASDRFTRLLTTLIPSL